MNAYHDLPYLDMLDHIMNEGVDSGDRTGVGTRKVWVCAMRFDLQQGFPLLTTKKLHTKSIIYELLWFLRGDTNIKWLNERGVTIWDDWRRPYTFDRDLVAVEKKYREYEPYHGTFSTDGLDVKRGQVDDKLRGLWVKMMRRCYDASSDRYPLYGGKGVSVCRRWHNIDTFVEDVKKLPHWFYKLKDWNNFELDKDYFGASQYGPDTSVWLHTAENNYYTDASTPLRVTTADEREFVFITLNEASRQLGIPNSTLSRFVSQGQPVGLKGHNKQYAGWDFSQLDLNGDLLRLKLIDDGDLGPVYGAMWRRWPTANGHIDQLQKSLYLLKANPNSRQNVVTAWNPGEIDQMALPPCHLLFQWQVMEGRLNCALYQRSCDSFLGVPFNIASYALLTHIMAAMAGLEVGEFVWVGGDVHIYTNHFDQVEKQLRRKPRPSPTLVMTDEPREKFEDWQFNDFQIVDYDPHPTIKAPVAV